MVHLEVSTEEPRGEGGDEQQSSPSSCTESLVEKPNNGLDEACQVVQSILNQISLHDSPPINENVPDPILHPPKKGKNKKIRKSRITTRSFPALPRTPSAALDASQRSLESSQCTEYSRQLVGDETRKYMESQGENSVASSDATSALSSLGYPVLLGSNEVAMQWMSQYQLRQKRAEMKMGNVALATLCNRTLESLDEDLVLGNIREAIEDNSLTDEDFDSLDESKENIRQLHENSASGKPGIRIKTSFSGEGEEEEEGPETPMKEVDTPRFEAEEPLSPLEMSPGWPGRAWAKQAKHSKRESYDPPGAMLTAKAIVTELDVDDDCFDNLPTPRSDVDSDESLGGDDFPDDSSSHSDHSEPGYSDDTDDSKQNSHEQQPQLEPHGKILEEDYSRPYHESQAEKSLEGSSFHEEMPFVQSTSDEMDEGDTGGTGPPLDEIEKPEMPGLKNEIVPWSEVVEVTVPSKENTAAPTPATPRLQMFGSEYARFLSGTPLAPGQVQSRKMHSRMKGRKKKRGAKLAASSGVGIPNVEDADDAVLTGAITDILVTHGCAQPPKGYYRISQTLFGDGFSALYKTGPGLGRRALQVHLNVKKEPNWDRAAQRPCVTALAVIFPDRNEFVPPGFCVVRQFGEDPETNAKGVTENSASSEPPKPANLNSRPNGERIFLCYRRSREGNPITGIIPLQPSNHEPIPDGFTVLERTPRNHVANINQGKDSNPIFLAFRQRLASLEPLRPLPLLLSVYNDMMTSDVPSRIAASPKSPKGSSRKSLRAYYCTGGTVVSSKVGKFHIMDRSTHSLLSPTSLLNRLALIQASRLKAGNVDLQSPTAVQARNVYASSDEVEILAEKVQSYQETNSSGGLDSKRSASLDTSRSSATSSVIGKEQVETCEIEGDATALLELSREESDDGTGEVSDVDHISLQRSFSTVSQNSVESRLSDNSGFKGPKSFFSSDDATLQVCLDALAFIPVVESADASEETNVLMAKVAVLTPILTACYTQHGGSALIAVQGLLSLLRDTDFFSIDDESSGSFLGSHTRLTLLDIAVQSVCDIATSTARETSFSMCIEFVQEAVSHASGRLNTRTIGYILRFYLFIFYFGASIPTSSISANTVWDAFDRGDTTTRSNAAIDDVPFLFDDRHGASTYLPGGAPQAACLGLKEMITMILDRLLLSVSDEQGAFPEADGSKANIGGFMEKLVSGLVDTAVRRVDLANFAQLAVHQIHRSGGSELFWYDMMNLCGDGLFGTIESLTQEKKNLSTLSFALLANLVKVSCGKIRKTAKTGSLVARDVASKLLSLELLLHYLEHLLSGLESQKEAHCLSSSQQAKEMIETTLFSVRRLLVPCLLSNTSPGLHDARVYRRVVRILSELWRNRCIRYKMKMELGILMEHFVLRLLQLGPQLLPPHRMGELGANDPSSATPDGDLSGEISGPLYKQQIDALFEINRWFDKEPLDFVEFFLNFDTDIAQHIEGANHLMPGTQWRICEQLCSALCAITEQSTEFIAEQIRESNNTNSGPLTPTAASSTSRYSFKNNNDTKAEREAEMVSARVAARQLQNASFVATTAIARCLAEAAGKSTSPDTQAALEKMHVLVRSKRPATPSTEQEPARPDTPLPSTPRSLTELYEDDAVQEISFDADSDQGGIIGYWRTIAAQRKKSTPTSRKIVNANTDDGNSVNTNRDGNESIQSTGSIQATTDETLRTAFEIVRKKNLKKGVDYLVACNFLSPSPREIATFLRLHHTRVNPMVLGEYLGEGGIDGGEIEYWNLIRFNYVRAISFVGMNVEEGLRHFLTNCGFRLPGEAQKIDRIMTTFAQCYWEDNAGDRHRCPFADQDTVFLISFAIIMLNTDLHKSRPQTPKARKPRKKMTKTEFINNLRGVAVDDEEITKTYIAAIYDSIEASPIELWDDVPPGILKGLKRPSQPRQRYNVNPVDSMLISMMKNVKKSEEVLRGLSVHEFSFYTIDDFSESMEYDKQSGALDLSRGTIAATWHHFHALIHATLEKAHLDMQAMGTCLDVLKYCLCFTICLDMETERTAFITQLARFKTFTDRKGGFSSVPSAKSHKVEEWYVNLEVAIASNDKTSALNQVRELLESLQSTLRVDTRARKTMTRVVRKIRNGQFLLNDLTRTFVKEGDLLKRSMRVGNKTTIYRFFLFSDVLVYAKETTNNEYKIHEELALHMMKIVDWFPNKQQKTVFHVHHPRKSFAVVCSSVEERIAWVRDIRDAIDGTARRLARLEGARMAVANADRVRLSTE